MTKTSETDRAGGEGDFVLTLMTSDMDEARAGVAAGVDRIGPDLEQLGKVDRQGGMGTRISVHDAGIIDALRLERGASALFARVDPVHDGTEAQITDLLARGAMVLMLPFFHDAPEVETFVRLVDGRAATTILCETAPAIFRLPEILKVDGIDEVHFGLTDLMLSTGVNSRYEILASDLFAAACALTAEAERPIHIAGVAALSDDRLPISADLTLARYAELGATGSLVTRIFVDYTGTGGQFSHEIAALKERYAHWVQVGPEARNAALREMRAKIAEMKAAGKSPP